VRLPAAVVEALKLKEGDHIEIRITREREFEVRYDQRKNKTLERLRKLRRPLPAGFVFDRKRPMPVRRASHGRFNGYVADAVCAGAFSAEFRKGKSNPGGRAKTPASESGRYKCRKTPRGRVNAALQRRSNPEGHDLSCPYKGKRGWRLSLSLIRVCWCSGHKAAPTFERRKREVSAFATPSARSRHCTAAG